MSCSREPHQIGQRYGRPPTPDEILAELQVIWPGCARRADRRGDIYGPRRISSLPLPYIMRVKWLLKWDSLHRLIDPATGGTLADAGWSCRLALKHASKKVFVHPLHPSREGDSAWADADEPGALQGPPAAAAIGDTSPDAPRRATGHTAASVAVVLHVPLPRVREWLQGKPAEADALDWCRARRQEVQHAGS